jgi:glutamate-1-semialdehyde 2,1-aminomutase
MSLSTVAELTANERIFEEACQVIPGGVNTSLRRFEPRLALTKAQGAVITDADGKQYIDYHAAFGPTVLGHNYPAVNAKVKASLDQLDLLGAGTTELETELARRICGHVPSAEKVLFTNSGSEATYSAIRLARAATGRKRLIKFQGCYHGWHDSVLMNVITPAERLGRRDPISAGSLPEVLENTLVCPFNDLDAVEETLRVHRGEVAAIILECIPHNIGCVMPAPGFLQGLRDLTKAHGTILIFDEVITGFRHGLGGYQKVAGVTPDLTTMGKSMANGYPIAAIAGRRDLMDMYNTAPGGTVFFAGTYNAHPLSTAAALATLEVLETPGAYARLFGLGERMRSGLRGIVERLGLRATVAGFGSVFLTYFMEGPIRNYADLLRNDAEKFVAYRRALTDRGFFKLPMNIKRACVSLSHTDAQIDATLDACEDVLRRVSR